MKRQAKRKTGVDATVVASGRTRWLVRFFHTSVSGIKEPINQYQGSSYRFSTNATKPLCATARAAQWRHYRRGRRPARGHAPKAEHRQLGLARQARFCTLKVSPRRAGTATSRTGCSTKRAGLCANMLNWSVCWNGAGTGQPEAFQSLAREVTESAQAVRVAIEGYRSHLQEHRW
jgi:hypothetical protein